MKKAGKFALAEHYCRVRADPRNPCNALIELLTETSTQIRASAKPKAPPPTLSKGEQKIITGTLDFGKYLLHSDFQPSRNGPWSATAGSCDAFLCYD
jgi:hypothetical protein